MYRWAYWGRYMPFRQAVPVPEEGDIEIIPTNRANPEGRTR
jgi:hypothetical protein